MVLGSSRRTVHQFGRHWYSQLAKTTTLLSLGVAANSAFPASAVHYGTPSTVTRIPVQQRPMTSTCKTRTLLEREMARHALEICHKAIQAVDPSQAVRSHLALDADTHTLRIGEETLNLQNYDELLLVAFGKASSAMAKAVLEQLLISDTNGELQLAISKCSGVVICKDDHATPKEESLLAQHGVHVRFASHPVPDERSTESASSLMKLVQDRASPRTLVVCCISGGGSALFCQPAAPLSLQDLQDTNSVLLASGMGIQEMNVIRKRLEEGKGGRLAANCYPSQLVTLVLSDVLGDPLDLIASGPTVPDMSTWQHAWDVVEQYQLQPKLSAKVVAFLEQGMQGTLADSPSSDHPTFQTGKTVLVGNNALAVEAAAHHAKALGYQPVVLGTRIEGEAKEVPQVYIAMAQHLQEQDQRPSPMAFGVASSLPVALIAGGETTVSLTPDSGKGGRNQELALSAALLLEKLNLRNVVLASVGTDGTDGPTDAAGAVVDAISIRHDLEGARQALGTHNAYPFLEQLGNVVSSEQGEERKTPGPLIKTGPTGTNVADICVTLIGPTP